MKDNLNPAYGNVGMDIGLRQHMTKTYNLIAMGLGVSAATAWIIGSTSLRGLFVAPEGLTALGHLGLWAPLLLLIGTAFVRAGSLSATKAVYWSFVALQGIGLALLTADMPASTVVQAISVTGFTFASMSLYGYTTKRNLSGMGSFLLMGLFGIIIAAIVNIFLGSPALNFAISVIGILVFSGFTAYDTQKLRDVYQQGIRNEDLEHARYWSALGLYLNIVNLFNFFVSFGRN